MAKYMVQWAVTSQDVVQADATAGDPVPTSHDLLLDAVQAALTDDCRRVLLYAAMAVEVLAGAKLDAAYKDALDSSGPSTSLRVRDYDHGGGKTERSDPVFVALRGRDRFAYLLHELPLYILGRSLALDGHALFQQALRLYRTRNKIAHTGQPPEEDQYLPTTRDGARRGLDAAFGVFKWFGDQGRLTNPLMPGLVRST